MNRTTYKRIGLAAALALLAPLDAFAANSGGGTIVYGPPAESIPTLSGAMMIVLGLLLAVLAFRVLRNHPGGQPLASIVALSIAGFAGVSGVNVIQKAEAGVITTFEMDQANGSSLIIGIQGTDVSVNNTSGRIQQIKSLTPDAFCSLGTVIGSPACAPGLIVPNNSACIVRWDCDQADQG